MAIDLFPLLRRLQVGTFENCVVLTYSADLYFFEQVVWPILRSRGCFNNVVLMDSRQYATTLDATGNLLHRLGKSYSVWPVQASNAFHPKLILQTNDNGGRLIIGSGNLTVRGFSSNWELFSEIASSKDSKASNLFAETWQLVMESAKGAPKAVRRQLEQMKATSGSVLSAETNEDWPRLLYSAPDRPSLLSQLKSLVGKTAVRRVIVVAPFFDAQLRAVQLLAREFGVTDIVAVVQSSTVSFPGKAAKATKQLAVHEFVAPHGSKSGYLHAKALLIQTSTTEYCVWGSANCSLAALAGQGNYEAMLVTKGKVGEGISTLGLSDSLTKEQKIDPGTLTLAEKNLPEADESLRIVSAEVSHGEVSLVIAPTARFSKCIGGHLKLFAKGEAIGQLSVSRFDNVTFGGRLQRITIEASVIGRLILQDTSGNQESAPFALHFLEELEAATPTRLQVRMHRITEAIRSGAFDWAKGLESVCELVIKIGLHDSAQNTTANSLARVRPKAAAPAQTETVHGDYDDFVSDTESEVQNEKDSSSSTFLEDVVATLRAQLLRSVTKDSDDQVAVENRDAWRYQEESERQAAESGTSVVQAESPDPEASEREYLRVRRGYLRLMSGLKRRCEWLRDHETAIGDDEFWRQDAVTLLLLDGCGRLVNNAHNLGTVLSPEDIVHEYLPAAAIFFGRIRELTTTKNRIAPLLEHVQADQLTAEMSASLQSTCALLTGLAAHARKHAERTLDENVSAEWPRFIEIVVVRCFAAILRKLTLPTPEEVCALALPSTWLASIGCNQLTDVFKDLCRLAGSVIRCEDDFVREGTRQVCDGLSPGEWVCTAGSGVTEVVHIDDEGVTIAMIGQPEEDDQWLKPVPKASVQRPNIPTKVRIKCQNIADELDHLLLYSNEDFEAWRDHIEPQLRGGYLISLQHVAHRARSSLLREEAAKLLAVNVQKNTSAPGGGTQV